MRVYLIRHGKAEARSHSGKDADRDLRDRGEQQAQWLGTHLASLDDAGRPSLIHASRILRARRTAEYIRDALGCEMRPEPLLENSGRNGDVIELIAARARDNTGGALALVGHNPQISDLVGALTGQRVEMRTGQAAAIDVDPDSRAGSLVTLLRMDEED